MLAYKFLKAEYAIQALHENRLKCATLDSLNDPFECFCYALKTNAHRWAFESAKERLGNKHAILCCSEVWDNPIIWSHYADSHKGICLELNFSNDKLGRRVNYISEPLAFPGTVTLEVANNILYSKFDGWSYEREIRFGATAFERENGLVFLPLDPYAHVTSVILGAECQVDFEKIRELVAGRSPEVTVRRARRSFSSFKMVSETPEHRDYDLYLSRKSPIAKFLTPRYRKVGRNAPCPCQSGLKYKDCHLKEK